MGRKSPPLNQLHHMIVRACIVTNCVDGRTLNRDQEDRTGVKKVYLQLLDMQKLSSVVLRGNVLLVKVHGRLLGFQWIENLQKKCSYDPSEK